MILVKGYGFQAPVVLRGFHSRIGAQIWVRFAGIAQAVSMILRMSIGQRWPEAEMRKWEVVFCSKMGSSLLLVKWGQVYY